ncbi:hypothetical protein [Oerskovia turbata]
MNSTDFERAAAAATHDVPFDATATLAAVRTSHRRHARTRRVLLGVPVAAVLAVGAVTIPSIVAPSVTTSTATAAYRFEQAPADVPVLATVDGLALQYLPAGFKHEPAVVDADADAKYEGGAYTTYSFGGPDGQEVTVTVTQIAGLTVDSYLETNWFDDPQPTTVGGRAAFVNQVAADGASGLVFSPEDGVVIELHADTKRGDELRTIVEYMSW